MGGCKESDTTGQLALFTKLANGWESALPAETLHIAEVSTRAPCLQAWGLSLPDLTQKAELHVPGTLAAGGPATLACSFRGTCKETKALFLSWKGPNVSTGTDSSSNSSPPLLCCASP